MALLHAVWTLRSELELEVRAAHFDHHLRDDSGEDRAFVESFADEHGIDCFCGDGDVAAYARSQGQSIEEAARTLRYRFLEDVAEEVGANRIATAHTESDQAETVLMRMIRGTGVRGMVGIHTRARTGSASVLLNVTRADTEAYCRACAVPFRDDPSNTDPRFERNRVRHEVLPRIREHSPDIDDHLARLAQSAADMVAQLRLRTRPLIAAHLAREGDGAWVLDTAPLAALDDGTLQLLLADVVVEHLGIGDNMGPTPLRTPHGDVPRRGGLGARVCHCRGCALASSTASWCSTRRRTTDRRSRRVWRSLQ